MTVLLGDFVTNNAGSPISGAPVTLRAASMQTPNPNPVSQSTSTDQYGWWQFIVAENTKWDVFVDWMGNQVPYRGNSSIPHSFTGAQFADGGIPAAKLGSDIARPNLLVNPGLEIWTHGNGPFTGHGTRTATGWTIAQLGTSTLSVALHSGANRDSPIGLYAGALTVGGTLSGDCLLYQNIENFQELRGQPIAVRCRVRASAASFVQVDIYDGVSGNLSAHHTGNNNVENLDVGYTVNAAATSLRIGLRLHAIGSTAYLDNCMGVVGTIPTSYQERAAGVDQLLASRIHKRLGGANSWPFFAGYASAAGGAQGQASLPFGAPMALTGGLSIPVAAIGGTWQLGGVASGQPTIGAVDWNGVALFVPTSALGWWSINSNASGYVDVLGYP